MEIKYCFKDWTNGLTIIFNRKEEIKKFLADYNHLLVHKYDCDPLEKDDFEIFEVYFNCSAEEALELPVNN